jgi:hypothetical protein
MPKHQAAVAGQSDIDHLDVGVDEPDIVLPRQLDRAVAENAP